MNIGKCEDRIVEMVFETDSTRFIQWLDLILEKAEISDDVVSYQTTDNRRGGFDWRCDPTTKAVMVAFAIAGMQLMKNQSATYSRI